MTSKITPTCRYGHGELYPATHPILNHVGGTSGEAGDWFALLTANPNGFVPMVGTFVMRAFLCRECTYMELHDVPTEEFEQTVAKVRNEFTAAPQETPDAK